jgi:hypothetical protein
MPFAKSETSAPATGIPRLSSTQPTTEPPVGSIADAGAATPRKSVAAIDRTADECFVTDSCKGSRYPARQSLSTPNPFDLSYDLDLRPWLATTT